MSSFTRFAGDLTLLYAQTKEKALSSVDKPETAPSLLHLDRRFRIQKDRLITWGLEWSDQDKGPGGDIDESVARAGMTDTITSVLGNIKEVLEQAEKIKTSVSSWPAAEKLSLPALQEKDYEDLLKDLSTSVDVLYEVSRHRRALSAGYHEEFAPGTIVSHSKSPIRRSSFVGSEHTLTNPSFARPALSPYAGLPASLDLQALRLPAEEPPPYESFGVPSATRMIGRIVKSAAPQSVQAALHGTSEEALVLVEYANYDPLYRDTGVPPPLQRLESLAPVLLQAQAKTRQSLTLLGYFEDPLQPRIGLVYDFLSATHGGVALLGLQSEQLVPVSLLNLVQAANKSAKPADVVNATPFLEDRFRVALRIAENLRDLHMEHFSHGNLNSGSVVFFRQGQNPQLRRGELHRPTLSGFDLFSKTRIECGTPASFNITRHPNDHESSSNDAKAIQFDLYGLALLLLEIGLWTPLHDLYKPKYSLKDFKLRIEKIWVPRLASRAGSLYMRAVQTCLRLSDEPDIGKIHTDKIYESIIRRLQRCCLLDEDEPLILTDNIPAADHSASWKSYTQVGRIRRNVSPAGHDLSPSPHDERRPSPSPSSFSTATTAWSDRKASSPSYEYSTPPTRSHTPLKKPSTFSSPHLRSRSSQSTVRDTAENQKTGLAAATTFVQNVWQSRHDSTVYPFREYRRKVMLIQSRWRERCKGKADNAPAARSVAGQPRKATTASSTAELHPSVVHTQHGHHARGLMPRKCQIFPVKLPQPALEEWHASLGLRLSRIVERALKGSAESSSIDLVSLGHDPISAKPTILITCASTARVKAALKRKFDYDRAMFDLKVRKGCISLARGKGPAREKLAKRTSGAESDEGESDDIANPFFQKRPLCGASIGAYLPSHGHLDPVTYGGIVMVEQKGRKQPYGLSVHHMLDPPEDESDCISESSASERANRSAATRSSALSDPPTDLSDSSDVSEYSESEDNDAGYISSDFESDLSDDEHTLTRQRVHHGPQDQGDRPGVQAGEVTQVSITQPAFRDAWEQNLHADDVPLEELDEDHLSSYKFGKVHASSGLKRLTRNGMRYEIDWALIELDPPRMQPFNLIQGGRRYCDAKATFLPALEDPVCRQSELFTAKEDLYPIDIMPANQLANLEVHCFGRTSGLQSGTIGAGMSFVKIRGRRNFSSSWSVIGQFGVGGDSGAWVIDNTSGKVCGHVLAERDGLTYICSMQLLFEDIKSTLGATSITLPGFGDSEDVPAYTCGPALSSNLADAVAALDLSSSSSARRSSGTHPLEKSTEMGRLHATKQTPALRT